MNKERAQTLRSIRAELNDEIVYSSNNGLSEYQVDRNRALREAMAIIDEMLKREGAA